MRSTTAGAPRWAKRSPQRLRRPGPTSTASGPAATIRSSAARASTPNGAGPSSSVRSNATMNERRLSRRNRRPSRKPAPLIRLLPAPRLAPKLTRGGPFSRPTPRAALTSRRQGWASALEVAHRLLVEQVLGAGKALAARVLVVASLPALHARRLRHDQRPPAHERVQQAHVHGRGRRAGSARDGRGARREADEKGEGQAGSDRAEVHHSLPIVDSLFHELPGLPR